MLGKELKVFNWLRRKKEQALEQVQPADTSLSFKELGKLPSRHKILELGETTVLTHFCYVPKE